MYSVKTKIKFLKAQCKAQLTKSRYMGNHPRSKKFILVTFLLVVNSFILFSLSVQMPKFEIRLANNIMIENTVHAISLPEEIIPVVVKPEIDLLDFIYSHESSRGLKNYSKCEAIGKFNRYGYGIPGDGTYVCFDKDEDTVATAGWIAYRKALGYSDNQLLCLYNTGKATDTCGYIQ